MSGKQLDENQIVNELKGSSLFFQAKASSAIPETPQKDASTVPVVSLPAPQQSKPTLPASPPPPPLQEPSQSPTAPATPATLLAPELPSSPTASSAPAVPETRQMHGNGDGTMVGLDDRRNVRTSERRKVRHSFDILSDQLLALRELAVERERTFGRKVLLGDLVQEALDMFISKERNHE